MSKQIAIPLETQFFRELAALAWKSLSVEQQEEIRKYLTLRFIDSGTDILDGSTESRILKRFDVLLDEGVFDEKLDEALRRDKAILSDATFRKCVLQVEKKMLDDLRDWMRDKLDERWRKWLKEPEGYETRIHEALDKILKDEEIDKIVFGAVRRQLSREDLKAAMVQQVEKAVKEQYAEATSSRE